MENRIYFRGLNSLRFYAAFLVIIYHIWNALERFGFSSFKRIPIFNKSDEAVSFFFILSGFLITYLLLQEKSLTGSVAVRKFYLRRILRIWPLYFLVVFVGLTFYNLFLPVVNIQFDVSYKLSFALFCYLVFLPNVMSVFFDVGGILNPAWSIGIEEQFYLIWAPLMKYVKKRILLLLLVVFALSVTIRVFFSYNPFHWDQKYINLIYTCRFHYMAVGGLAAFLLVHFRNRLLKLSVFKTKSLQWLQFMLLLAFLFAYDHQLVVYAHWIFIELVVLYLFVWLIVNVAINPMNVIKIDSKFTNWLGRISYGLYMYHMIVLTLSMFVFQKIQPYLNNYLGSALFFVVVFGGSILLSQLSFKYFESRFLRIKDHLQSVKSSF